MKKLHNLTLKTRRYNLKELLIHLRRLLHPFQILQYFILQLLRQPRLPHRHSSKIQNLLPHRVFLIHLGHQVGNTTEYESCDDGAEDNDG